MVLLRLTSTMSSALSAFVTPTFPSAAFKQSSQPWVLHLKKEKVSHLQQTDTTWVRRSMWAKCQSPDLCVFSPRTLLAIRFSRRSKQLCPRRVWKPIQQVNSEGTSIGCSVNVQGVSARLRVLFYGAARKESHISFPLLTRRPWQFFMQPWEMPSPRDISVLPQGRPLVRCYSDASFENGTLRLGWVVFLPNTTPIGGTCLVPPEEIDLWIPRKQQIFPGEALCGLVVPLHLSSLLKNCDILWWGDNEAAIAALARGTSSQDDVHELVQATHLTLHRLSSRVWWEWIDTSSNPSDGLSRSGLTDPWTLSQNWKLEETVLPRCGF